VVPANDLEALEIRKLLASHEEKFCVSAQPWGATWSGLEPEIRDAVGCFRAQHPAGEIFGVELGGRNEFGAKDIDHHLYSDGDRRSPLSSLEQVAAVLGAELSHWQKLVAANDRGYIPAMIGAGASAEEVTRIRAADRAAQGLTAGDEADAERDIRERAEWRGFKVLVHCVHRPTSAHSDRLSTAGEILLAGPAEWCYFGPRHYALAAMDFREDHWSGGSAASGYFGVKSPSPTTQERVVQFFWS
jgi:hypothetical protein